MTFMHTPVDVAVVSPYELTREGLAAILQAYGNDDIRLVDASVGSLAVPDVALFDPAYLRSGGLAELRRLIKMGCIILGIDRGIPVDLERARVAGITRFVSLHMTPAELIQCIVETADDRSQAPPMADRAWAGITPEPALTAGLTRRELEVLTCVAMGLPNADISTQLYMSINTVKTHIRLAYSKIGVKNRSQAVAWVISNGL
jgi:DNA-binding NarL/FixJ family response regulator